jgi:hypothetical protein
MEMIISITKPDAIGPRKDDDIKVPVDKEGVLTFRGSQLTWREAPPCPVANKLASMTIKELKAALVARGVDPAGCVERPDFEARLLRAGGVLEEPQEPVAAVEPTAVEEAPSEVQAAKAVEGGEKSDAAPSLEQATPAAESQPAAAEAEPEAAEENCFTLEQLTDKRVWETLNIQATERETYLSNKAFAELFGMPKADFAKMPKWKKDNAKKKHGLF